MHFYKSEGPGTPDLALLKSCGENVIIEDGVRIFYPENIIIGNNVYIGHDTIIKGYYKDKLIIGDNVWIGQGCFIHGAGSVSIGSMVGIGPHVKIHAAYHHNDCIEDPILFQPLEYDPIVIEDNTNIGIGAMIMHGVVIREGSIVGANAVVTKSFPEFSIIAGVPAKLIRSRKYGKFIES